MTLKMLPWTQRTNNLLWVVKLYYYGQEFTKFLNRGHLEFLQARKLYQREFQSFHSKSQLSHLTVLGSSQLSWTSDLVQPIRFEQVPWCITSRWIISSLIGYDNGRTLAAKTCSNYTMEIWYASYNVVNWHSPGISLTSIDHHAPHWVNRSAWSWCPHLRLLFRALELLSDWKNVAWVWSFYNPLEVCQNYIRDVSFLKVV